MSADRRTGLPGGLPPRARAAIARCADGTLPPAVALTWLVMAGLAADEAAEAIATASARLAATGARAETERLRGAARLLAEAPEALDAVAAVLDAHEAPPPAAVSGDDAVAHWAAVFDRAGARSPEASVALYSLGRPALLDAVTDEIVAWLAAQGLLGADRRVLDLGCGIGRFLVALAPQVALIVGTEVSAVMARTARTRSRDHRNVAVLRTGGRDLAPFRDETFDLVLAVDTMPYLVAAGVADRHVAEASRVLRPGGSLVALNWSYGGDIATDRAAVASLAERSGLAVRVNGSHPFRGWDGAAFLLHRAGAFV
ncbi:Demethylrebeccamycin-D-glucose O-methyltransferase [Rhodoplanes serenus]|uniref:Demethylrebeccamycin-D-glucose O-methyltransferase n=1 Tax=Rhodoplanes serenus TaxID=200615 RepID=A0A447CVX4_9BRAD|nr:class I SAM-dependent methyltransferase [Rhodoplanes serenus]VCU09444.1 Demethylrebeccamycin-D-glucose O-methyltransferase [Rhodoplanes serenus]